MEGVEEKKKEKNRQKGESNRQQTIYRALNYFISNRTTFDLANGKARMYRILLDTKIDKRNEWGRSIWSDYLATEEGIRRESKCAR